MGPKNRHIGCVLAFFLTLSEQTKTVNTDVFGASEAQSQRIYGVFSSGNKSHGIYNVFWPGPGKNTGIYSACCEKNFFHATGTKTL